VAALVDGGVNIGEVAAATAGDADFFAGEFGVIDHKDGAAALAGFYGRHHAGSTGAEHHDVVVDHGSSSLLVCGSYRGWGVGCKGGRCSLRGGGLLRGFTPHPSPLPGGARGQIEVGETSVTPKAGR